MKHWVTALGIIAMVVPACDGADPAENDRASAEFFERKIRPLLIQRCDECHSTEKSDESGHLALDNRTALLAGGSRGPVFVAGKPDESLLVKAIRYADPQLQMPPEGKLADSEIELLSKWIRDGAFVPDYGKDATRKTKEIDWADARQFWSFRNLAAVELPSVSEPATVQNPVDLFVMDQLRAHELVPAAPADKQTLVRRLSFDLLGLPPSLDEVAEFDEDERPDAYERLVDRLLASPHFGERWARYWLDLVRYVDSTPDWQKNTDGAWMYRDWVVRAINEDRPYNEFVRMQLAADLADVEPRDIAALGMLGVSPTYWKELKLAPSVIEVIVADEWDERLDTVTRTFLGLTVACARCHDHKFDPVTVRDYYALAGVFASTQVCDRPLLSPMIAEQVIEAKGRLNALQENLKKQNDKESDEGKSLQRQITELREANLLIDVPLAPVVEDSSVYVVANGPDATKLEYRKQQPRDLPVFRRGNPGNPGDIVPRRFLQLFTGPAAESGEPVSATDALSNPSFRLGSGRLELAEALLNDAKPLTARVVVNRIWMHHFGRGLVRTPGDFGRQGDRPSHPELLDWLAGRLTDDSRGQPWSLKVLHRLMVTSGTYRQASAVSGSSASRRRSLTNDPDNHLLSRMNRRRLEIEPWRDAMLFVSGNLDDRMEGAGMELDQQAHVRRTLYARIGRDEQSDLLRIHDFPPPTTHSPSRDVTTTPLQQLFVLNSDFVEHQAANLAKRLLEPVDISTAKRIESCYQLMFQRSPLASELKLGERFLAEPGGDAADAGRWRSYVQSLLGLNEFLFVD